MDRNPADVAAPAPERDAWTLFAVMWAIAALFHLIGNAQLAPTWSEGLLGLCILIALARPSQPWALLPLAVAQLASTWVEAPVLGNHWLLAAFVNAVILLAVASRIVRRHPLGARGLLAQVAPPARLVLLSFYAFAAFAKLNHDFFNPAVSCATFYFRESTNSLHLSGLQLGGTMWLQRTVILATVATELSVPLLLGIRRTRHVGVVVALAFHFVLALDRTHQFFDFSSVLAALFVLFLPVGFGACVLGRARKINRWFHAAALCGAAALTVLAMQPPSATLAARLRDIGVALWVLYGAALIASAAEHVWRERATPAPRALLPVGVVALVPILVVLNGLTPYIELKTGYGWNMYSNLRTVAGETNHLIVPGTLRLTRAQDDIVTIVDSNDPRLLYYRDRHYGLVLRELRTYLSRHHEVSLTYVLHGQRRSAARVGDHPELVEPVPLWLDKLFLFRAIDLEPNERCLPTFGPAR